MVRGSSLIIDLICPYLSFIWSYLSFICSLFAESLFVPYLSLKCSYFSNGSFSHGSFCGYEKVQAANPQLCKDWINGSRRTDAAPIIFWAPSRSGSEHMRLARQTCYTISQANPKQVRPKWNRLQTENSMQVSRNPFRDWNWTDWGNSCANDPGAMWKIHSGLQTKACAPSCGSWRISCIWSVKETSGWAIQPNVHKKHTAGYSHVQELT